MSNIQRIIKNRFITCGLGKNEFRSDLQGNLLISHNKDSSKIS